MARTNSLWIVQIFYDKTKKNLYITNTEIYDVSNFYHRITKPKGIFEYLIIYKTV